MRGVEEEDTKINKKSRKWEKDNSVLMDGNANFEPTRSGVASPSSPRKMKKTLEVALEGTSFGSCTVIRIDFINGLWRHQRHRERQHTSGS